MTKTIIPDALIQNIDEFGDITYKVIDAKTSVKKDLVSMGDLTNTCTPNQKLVYPAIDVLEGTITKVEMRGDQAKGAFDNELFNENGRAIIQLETNVEFWVNRSKTDFLQYLTRPRIKQ